jgi:hypothetical protein
VELVVKGVIIQYPQVDTAGAGIIAMLDRALEEVGMISRWLSASEISGIISITKQGVLTRTSREHWPSRTEKANGGTRRIYQVAALPEDIQSAYAASLKLSLTELQSRLKPPSKHEKKIDIPRYNGRGAKTKAVKPVEGTACADLRTASARRKLIEAYNASGLAVYHRHGVANCGNGSADTATYTRSRTFTSGLPNTSVTGWRGLPRSKQGRFRRVPGRPGQGVNPCVVS